MPTTLRYKGYRFFFFSLEGKEPPHIHVERGECYAKFWLDPVSLARSRGFRNYEIVEIQRIIKAKKSLFEEKWHGHFGRKD
jgi:hypothetical protein